MQVHHGLHNCKRNLELLLFFELFVLLVQLVIQTAVLEILSDEGVTINCYAHPHVQHDVGMLEVADNFELLQEISLVCMFP